MTVITGSKQSESSQSFSLAGAPNESHLCTCRVVSGRRQAERQQETTGHLWEDKKFVGGKNANNYSQYFLRCEEQEDRK